MKLIPTAHELISDMRAFFQTNNAKLGYLNEEPLRDELFSSDQMERYGKTLARTHKLSTKPAQDHLLKRLANNEIALHKVRKLISDSIKRKNQITPAAEWLIDNFYLVEDHIRNAKKHFPRGYSEDLPQLIDETSGGLTRVYDIVLKIIAHSDGRIDMESLSSFVKAYQSVTNLHLGELWAIPIMLRLALIENLRRVSTQIAIDAVDRNLADYWSKQMVETAEKDPKNLILVIADMARSNPPMVSAFVSELTRQIRGKGPDLALALNWIERQLSESGLTSAELVNAEYQKQAADQVSMSNSIGSLRLLGAMDWRDFVESHSIVEQKLREDNGGIYGLMDFSTRDNYRHVVERIAKKSKISEYEVACIAIKLAHENLHGMELDQSTSHVGYYLIGPGVIHTIKLAKTQISGMHKFRSVLQKHSFKVYLTFILLITIAISTGILIKAFSDNSNNWLLLLIAFLSFLSASQLAISVVNFFSTLLVKPHLLPRMDFSHMIPPEFRTLVVIPVMLTSEEEIENLIESLEVRFLANRNDNLHFALLTDFTDAIVETRPEDEALVNFAQHRIEELNKKYGREKNNLFYLFHRPRHWNSSENKWMGYERKRGKILELNSLLRGSSKERFSRIIGDQSVFPTVKYVITLDADTQLPLGSAWKLIGTMAHPLNHAWYDEKKKRVTKGYSILQPRVTINLPDATSSIYTRLHGNEPGIDPYTRASSDVYQDLFAEGSFIGKGIYEVDSFNKVLDGSFPENAILSHDLLEGCYIRSGLLSDVQLFEKYPTSYNADIKRFSRWIRGDWQIFSWFLPVVPDANGKWHKNPLSGLSRWKIFDNIRRSLVPISLTCLILLGWIASPSSLFWSIAVTGIIIIPILITSIWNIIKKPKDVIFTHHIKISILNITDIFKKTLFTLICLPYEAFSNLIAITKTIWRILITRKNLLEWNPSNHKENAIQINLFTSYSTMWIEPSLAIVIFIYLSIYLPVKLYIAGPFLILWCIAPFITWWLSNPLAKKVSKLTDDQTIFLRKLARKTYNYFERFVGVADNWLPPDNFQEQPIELIAHRTSPTNIGLSLLSNVSAYEFGFITSGQLIEKTSKTINTMTAMERYRGHFYNWYNNESLNPLLPKYISTVDSGNLAGHLLILKQGLLSILHQKIIDIKLFEGLRDTLRVLTDTLEEEADSALLYPFIIDLEEVCNAVLITDHDAKIHTDKLIKKLSAILDKLNDNELSETYKWKQILLKQLENLDEEIKIITPWHLLNSAPPEFKDIDTINENLTLVGMLKKAIALKDELDNRQYGNITLLEKEWLESFTSSLTNSIHIAEERILVINNLVQQCNEFADMDWDFLFDNSSKLLTIGYNVHEHKMDPSYYDLLASEARFCVYIAIAQGKLPEESWFALSRLLTNVEGDPILLSWSGSMFEYLMPLLIMPTYENTLLDQTCKAAVEWQIDYGKQIGLPWGISESGFNMINANSHYQYRAFGAPGLGLKRGLEEDSVIAPYASALALMVEPRKSCKNLQLLYEKGLEGQYGFYEAIDYTPARLQRGQTSAIIYSYMAHHQGMSLLSLAYLLLDKPMQKLFEAEAQFKAVILLLQERIPKATAFYAHTTDIEDINYIAEGVVTRIINTPNTSLPEIQLLSNGRYHVMITNAGSGYSRLKDLSVTRWREDGTCDNWGTFCYIRDLKTGNYWSNTHQPTLKKVDKYEAAFSQGRVDFRNTNYEIETHTEIVVSPEDDIEMRRMRISNCSDIRRTIEITSYAEVVLTTAVSDIMQPVFNNLFMQSEIVPLQHAIICSRRPRSIEEFPSWMFHLMTMQGKVADEISYETNRMEFIGRGNTIVNPQVMNHPGPLAGNQGSVLDPIVAIRYKITLEPDEAVTLDMVTGVAETKEMCLSLIGKYQDKHHKDRVFELAWTHSQVVLRQINASETDAQLYARLASSILFTNSSYRADPAILISNHKGQSGLWGYSISGDLPIVLLIIEKQANFKLVKQLVQAHAYWRLKGLAVDLVIWNEEHYGYRQVFQNEIEALVPIEFKDRPGGVFVRASDQISNEDRILFQTVARIYISDNDGTLVDHVKRKQLPRVVIPYLIPSQSYKPSVIKIPIRMDLRFYNGLGGFSADGNEYVINIDHKNKTPVPWVNVIANPNFGTVISESGTAYTWIENAHELRLTPWKNDPVCDSGGEAYYLRDEESGYFWSTTFLPRGAYSSFVTRHGFGYSIFEHIEDGIYSEMLVFVDIEAAVKFTVLKIRNQSGRSRKLSATGYVEWVLDNNKSKTLMHIHTEVDPDSGALFAKNSYNTEFGKRVAFFDVDYLKKSFTSDRAEFIGRNGTLQNPDAMSRQKLSGRIGIALDPCAAIQVPFDMADGEEQEIIFRLGAGKNLKEASTIVRLYRGSMAARESFEKVKNYWKDTIDSLKIETPDEAINIITNGWLTYQTLSSRIWGRSGYYQSGGAFGFRDQLQDVLSILHFAPQLAREHILRCASHQFIEGDVQHWWHPPSNYGVRTRCSDDFLWLPYVTSLYISHTGDSGILDVSTTFIEGRHLNIGEESYYDRPIQSIRSASLYDHCVQAIKHGSIFGEHGLPLIGTGDWNDGFDKVGKDGKGESVWMAFFLYDILIQFAEVSHLHKDLVFADECKKLAQQLNDSIDKYAWDGEWYKRAWFDDGTALGSSINQECKIDSISQSWSVISGAGNASRIKTAMESAYNKLVQKDARIIQLLTPAFDKSKLNPGYIKGYVPGVRENGGQYTHAAIWMIIAFAKLGDNKRVWELLKMINPINHGNTPESIAIYKVEPYVIAADVYAVVPHVGRGGWTWYTGSAGWMFRLIIEFFLGMQLKGNKLSFSPCIPDEWESFKLHYKYKTSTYQILVTQINHGKEIIVSVDGLVQKDKLITLLDDGMVHNVVIELS